MGRPAVPKYLDKHVLRDGKLAAGISPGQRFGLLFPFWSEKDWTADSQDKSKTNALKQVLPLSEENRRLLDALVQRQKTLAEQAGESTVRFEAISTSPFMTGIGNEHPLENGFSFLNPYGLPYLPASAVKGLLRRAAEELACGEFGEGGGWQYPDVWLLFGFDASSGYLRGESRSDSDPAIIDLARQEKKAFQEAIEDGAWDAESVRFFMNQVLSGQTLDWYQSDPRPFLKDLAGEAREALAREPLDTRELHFKGALSFWDVFPVPPGGGKETGFLRIEILTPHYSDYYQKKQTPADCGQPVPNPFLTVAPGCSFTFFVVCNTTSLPDDLKRRWKKLLQAAFNHAFDWLGFGAKTAVGYGQLRSSMLHPIGEQEELDQCTGKEVPESPPSPAFTIEIWEKATLSWKKNNRTLTATHADGKRRTAPSHNPDRAMIPEALHKPLFEPKKPKPVYARVTVRVQRNQIDIEMIEMET